MCGSVKKTAELRYVAETMRPQSLDMWQIERDCRENEATELDIFQREGDCRPYICGRDKEATEPVYVAESK